MKYFSLASSVAFSVFVITWTHKNVQANYVRKNLEISFHSNESVKASANCKTLFILDLSKHVISKDVFDISIKKFLQFVSKFCNEFRYTIMDENYADDCDSCMMNTYDCVDISCRNIVFDMDYSNVTLSYFDEMYDESSNVAWIYFRHLKATISAMNSCTGYSVLLLTNRIVYMNIDDDFQRIIENFGIKFTTILLGRNDTNATDHLEIAFKDIPSVTTLSFANYDCLSYLLYCILPCSQESIECVKSDVDDCHDFSVLTPNPSPETTLHVWFVESFNRRLNEDGDPFGHIVAGMRLGMQDYIEINDISSVRFRMITSRSDINKACEHFDFPTIDCQAGTRLVPAGESIGNDFNDTNDRLSLIPWSSALTNTKVGIFSVIILTNFATTDLITYKNNQSLFGWMYVYDTSAYTYYSAYFKNTKNFHISYLDYSDIVNIIPIDASSTTFTTETPTQRTESTNRVEETISNTQTALTKTTYSGNAALPKDKSLFNFFLFFLIIIQC